MEKRTLEDIQDLFEKFDFEELSPRDRQAVLALMSKEDYKMYRQTVLEATALFSEANEYQTKPLVLPTKTHLLATPIPLYKALIGIAAMALLMLLAFPIKKIPTSEQAVKYITKYDTIETEVVKYDTVEKIIEKPVVKERLVYVNNNQITTIPEEAPRLLDVPRTNQDLSFSPATIKNKGVSMKDDTLIFSLPRVY
jgi:hypothetical protein